MRRLKICALLGIMLLSSSMGGWTARAEMGDMGFFGGISEGTRLPKTTEILLAQANTRNNSSSSTAELTYKEVVFLDGTPQTFEGLLTVKRAAIKDTDVVGTTTESYAVSASASTATDAVIDRYIQFTVKFRREGNQLIKDYEVSSWDETVTVPGGTFIIDPLQSRFGVSIIEDHTPGVTYYKGNISQRAVYTGGEDGIGATTQESSGSFYGYSSAWSSTETHRTDITVSNSAWQMMLQIRPSVSVSKLLQYDKNEPTAISFPGNYREVMQNVSGLEYDIFVKPNKFYDVAGSGKENIPVFNSFEQLIAPNMNYLKGHFAEADISRLFAMQVLDGDPKFFQPSQAATRGEYVTALVKAIKMPITPVDTSSKKRKNDVVRIVFPDVTEERAEYPYIMAAYNSKLAVGRENSLFAVDKPIARQEAIVILIRTLGLENLGLDPTPLTSFMDDYNIATWAMKEVYAAQRLGIISGDADGNFRPTDYVSKAEAAAFVNRLIEYMRADLAADYTDHIVNYAS